MSELSYLARTKEALGHVREAMEQAAAGLPPDVRQQHWIAQKTSPEPWVSVEHWHARRASTPQWEAIADTLSHLVRLAIVREHLHAIVQTAAARQRPPDLSLPRVRRAQ